MQEYISDITDSDIFVEYTLTSTLIQENNIEYEYVENEWMDVRYKIILT